MEEDQPNISRVKSSNLRTIILISSVIVTLLVISGLIGAIVIKKDKESKTVMLQKEIPATINIKRAPIELPGCTEFTNLEFALTRPDEVCYLNLSGQNLKEAPTEISKLTKLMKISLANNKLTIFP